MSIENNKIRVRFAPSPTGDMHLGNARTAIMNYIFAKQNKGEFLLRIEDTDVARSKQEYIDNLIDTLKWLQITWNEKPIIQSERFETYRSKAQNLIDQNYAYYCQCIKEVENTKVVRCDCRNKNLTSGVIRFKIENSQILEFNDLVYGNLKVNTSEIEDFALVRSDGTPTYMLCVVIDDIYSDITHVIRGEDHRTNTFKQMLLYNAFNAKIPQFGHLPMILGDDGKKLSKRNGGSSVEYFRSIGIDSNGLTNYLMRLGWGYGNTEYFKFDELLQYFDINKVRRSASTFDINKMYKCSNYAMQYKDMTEFNQYMNKYASYINVPQELYKNTASKCYSYAQVYEYLEFIVKDVKCEVNIDEVMQIKEYFVLNKNMVFDFNNADIVIKHLVKNNLHKTFRLIMTGKNVGCDLTLGLTALTYARIMQKINLYF